MNDWQLSQWISQALAGELDDSQQADLQAALQRSPASQVFAQWSSRIQAAAAETHRIESLPPDETVFEPAERLSDLSKARLQRSLLAARDEWRAHDAQQYLRVAQSPSVYSNHPAATPQADAAELRPDANRSFDELLRGGRELCGRLNAQISGLLQAVYWAAELASLSNLQAPAVRTPPLARSPVGSASARMPLSLEQLESVLLSMLRVQTSLCSISVAHYQKNGQAHNFGELLRVQRGPRDLTQPRLIPSDRLRHGAASPFHQAVFAASTPTPILDVDRSIAGSPRIAVGLPLAVRQHQAEATTDSATDAASIAVSTETYGLGSPWGLTIVEADIDRLLNTHIAAGGVAAAVTLLDQHNQILFSAPPRAGAPTRSAAAPSSVISELDQQFAQTGELHLPNRGVWASLLTCAAPLDNLRLILSTPDT